MNSKDFIKIYYFCTGKKFPTLLVLSLIISSIFHIWNAVGYPTIHLDEGTYMARAMYIIKGLGLKDGSWVYDHPFFGPIFLASIMGLFGYPSIAKLDLNNRDSYSSLYSFPRILMGILAVIDTFLIYKIGELRYGRNVAFIASILFAVMPLTWMLRRIYLESILLPFMLTSIFFAVKIQGNDLSFKIISGYGYRGNNPSISRSNRFYLLMSGALLGLAIFTKIPILTMIPLVAYLVYTSSKSFKFVGLWLIPVITIPLIWPAYAILSGELGEWISGVEWQLSRSNDSFLDSLYSIFVIDPGLAILAIVGILFAAYKRDFLILLWVLPIALFFAMVVSYVNWFHWIPIQPVLCISIANFVNLLLSRSHLPNRLRQIIGISFVSIVIFGALGTWSIITLNLSAFQVESLEFTVKLLGDASYTPTDFTADRSKKSVLNDGRSIQYYEFNRNNVTIISSPIYSWIFRYVFDYGDRAHSSYLENKTVTSGQTILIVDRYFRDYLMEDYQPFQNDTTKTRSDFYQLVKINKAASTIASFEGITSAYNRFEYPYTSLRYNFGGSPVEVKVYNLPSP